MRTIQFSRFGEPKDVLEVVEGPAPTAGPGEVLVTLTARAIHPSDLMNVRGLYGRPPALPFVPGNDAAGVVAAVGPGVTAFKAGDRVTLLLGATGGRGTWKEQVAVPQAMLVPTPARLSDAQAGALWVNYLSIWVMAVEVLHLPRGEVLLQTAAGSQLGRAMVELARLRGFSLINVVRRRAQANELSAAGVENVVCTEDESIPARVKELTGKAGLRYAIDAVGGATGAQVLEALSPGGTALLFGALEGAPISVNPGLVLFKELTLKGFWLTRWLQATAPAHVRTAVEHILTHAGAGDFSPALDERFPLSRFRDAVLRAETPGRVGSVVLEP